MTIHLPLYRVFLRNLQLGLSHIKKHYAKDVFSELPTGKSNRDKRGNGGYKCFPIHIPHLSTNLPEYSAEREALNIQIFPDIHQQKLSQEFIYDSLDKFENSEPCWDKINALVHSPEKENLLAENREMTFSPLLGLHHPKPYLVSTTRWHLLFQHILFPIPIALLSHKY